MKQHFRQILFLICTALIMVCAVFAWAGAEEATPTDLAPKAAEEAQETVPEETAAEAPERKAETPAPAEEAGEPEDASDGVEVIVTRTLGVGQSWEGRSKKTRPAVLKLDVEEEQEIHMIVEGKDVCFSVRKTDEAEENARKYSTDPETKLKVVSWRAEKGSWLITVYPDENSLMVQARVSFPDEEAFAAWEAERKAETEEETPAEEQEETGEEDGEEPALALPENRSIHIDLKWDTDHPRIGDVAHFDSVITGYENFAYTLQWQISRDEETWTDYAGATAPQLDVELTEELNGAYFRLVIYVESEREA